MQDYEGSRSFRSTLDYQGYRLPEDYDNGAWTSDQDFGNHNREYGANEAPANDAPYRSGEHYHPAGPSSRRELHRTVGFKGKGPKGYKRSDERIYEEVCELLTHDHEVDGTHIEVKVEDGVVTLTGSVLDRRMKRIAEDVVERVAGVNDIYNELSIQGKH